MSSIKMSKEFTQSVYINSVVVLVFGVLVFFQNCSKVSSVEQNESVAPLATASIAKYVSDTTGGGDFGYEIVDSGEFYTVRLLHYNFVDYSERFKSFRIFKSEKGSTVSRPLVGEQSILNLMSGACDFIFVKPQSSCDDCMTGSWNATWITKPDAKQPVRTYGLENCKESVDLSKIDELIYSEFNLSVQ